jgi:hypothetical protein
MGLELVDEATKHTSRESHTDGFDELDNDGVARGQHNGCGSGI